MCKILLKESLLLQNNRLNSLTSGGQLNDLSLLVTLNLNSNKFKKLPMDLYRLINLRELFISDNQLEYLPTTINQLKKLELLDISYNQLTDINQITMMPLLRILNITYNNRLRELPNSLITCDSLCDLILNPELIVYPSSDITVMGTIAILEYLQTNENNSGGGISDHQKFKFEELKNATQRFIAVEKKEVRETLID